MPLESYANRAVVDVLFTFVNVDTTAYAFTGRVNLFLSIYDVRDGKLMKQWVNNAGLTISSNTITWNERDATAMNFSKGKYYYELGYTIVNYASEDQVCLAFGDMKFI